MKARLGFVSNSSSSSFLCLGVEDYNIIKKMFSAEGLKKNADGYYDEEGYGAVSGKNVMFYGNSGDDSWYAAGLDEKETRDILETNSLKEARKKFVKLMRDRLNLDIPENKVKLIFGESSSE